IVILGTLLYYPFVKSFASAYLSIELWKGERTGLGEYLVVHGIFLFVIVTWLVARVLDTPERRKIFVDVMPLLIVAFIVVETAFILTNLMAFAIAFPLLALTLILLVRPDLDARARFIALLIAAGLAMTMMVEVIVYKGDIGRMNTVFKFYLQVWVFFAIAAAAVSGQWSAVSQSGQIGNRKSKILNSVWWAMFALLVFIGLLYPITATPAKVHDRYTRGAPPGLNGMEFMRGAIYQDRNYDQHLESDYRAIQWLRENIEGSPVILEGNAPLYHWASRVSIYTGLPTVIGWDWHQKQQRSIIDGTIIDRRIAAVREMYNTRSTIDVMMLLKRFRVQYVYVGDLERAFYDATGLAKFDAMARAGQLQVVYENERVKIYKVLD
ncbi:MAG: DUF2298 domain-containing protein, partial [Anaerolineae bacterium]|nr:DUF2298 domain-containing protein [Anaerolineae bacterium]